MSRGGNDYQSTSPPLLALTRGKQKRDILLEIAVTIIIITITKNSQVSKICKLTMLSWVVSCPGGFRA